MADLLSHILAAYVVLTILGWRVDWITKRWIVIGMAGAAIPDLVKIGIVLDDSVIEGIIGTGFSYSPISSLGGVLVIAAAITLLFEDEHRRVYGFLVTGGLLSLIGDGLRMFADSQAGFWLYPFWWRPPTPNLYVTSDPRVIIIFLILSAGVFLLDRRILGDHS